MLYVSVNSSMIVKMHIELALYSFLFDKKRLNIKEVTLWWMGILLPVQCKKGAYFYEIVMFLVFAIMVCIGDVLK